MTPFLPDTNEEALARWDLGEPIHVIEMGGLGPGYEQCIQIAVIELIRRFMNYKSVVPATRYPVDERAKKRAAVLEDRFRKVLEEIDTAHDLRLTMAQAAAAKSAAWNFLADGYKKAIEKIKVEAPDRLIMVSRHWPNDKPVKGTGGCHATNR